MPGILVDRRAVVAFAGLAFCAATDARSATARTRKRHKDPSRDTGSRTQSMTFGNFFVSGHFKSEVIRDFGKNGIVPMRSKLEGIARQLDGTLNSFYLVGGTWKMEAVFAVPPAISSDLVFMLLSSGMFESDFRLARVLSPLEADRTLATAGPSEQPWTAKPL